jgi:hypothetical protein
LARLSRTGKSDSTAEFGRDEVLMCMVLAFCIAGASVDVVYKVLG